MFLAAFALAMTVQSSVLYGYTTSLPFRAIVWPSNIAAVILFMLWEYRLLAYIARRRKRTVVIVSAFLHLLPNLVVTIATATATAKIYGDAGTPFHFPMPDYLKDLATSLAAEFIIVTWLLPAFGVDMRVRRQKAVVAIEATAHTPRSITVGDRSFPLEQVISIRSEGHYLELVTLTGKLFLRGKLKDVVSQLAVRDGIQPHRSYWVGERHIQGLQADDGQKVLKTTGGDIPVSRARATEVAKWLEAYRPDLQ